MHRLARPDAWLDGSQRRTVCTERGVEKKTGLSSEIQAGSRSYICGNDSSQERNRGKTLLAGQPCFRRPVAVIRHKRISHAEALSQSSSWNVERLLRNLEFSIPHKYPSPELFLWRRSYSREVLFRQAMKSGQKMPPQFTLGAYCSDSNLRVETNRSETFS